MSGANSAGFTTITVAGLKLPLGLVAPALFTALAKLLVHKTPSELAGELAGHVPDELRPAVAEVLGAAVDHLTGSDATGSR